MSVLAICHQCLVVLSACSKDCSAAPGRVLKKEELSDPAPRDGTPRPVTAAAQGLLRALSPARGVARARFQLTLEVVLDRAHS